MKAFIKFSAIASLALAACTGLEDPTGTGTEPGGNFTPDQMITLTSEAAASATLTINPDGNWQAINKINWLIIGPMSGFAGENTLTLKAISSNTELSERSASFDIVVNETDTIRCHVAQLGVAGLEITTNSVGANGTGGEAYAYVKTNTEFTATFDQDWATVKDIEYNISSDMLDDGVTPSSLQTARVVLDVQANPSSDLRTGELTITCGENNYNVTVSQGLSNDAVITDFDTPFLRRTLAMRFTATWCGYCPIMAESYKLAAAANPDKFIPMSIHSGDSDVYSQSGDALFSMFRLQGYPSGIVNAYALVENYSPSITSTMLSGLVEEATTSLPAKTAISTVTETSDGVFKIMCSVATKEARPYSLHVFLMENGVVENQSFYDPTYPGGKDYVHDYVERCAVTGVSGVQIYGVPNGVVNYSLEYEIPANVIENMDNAYALVFVTYEPDETFRGDVMNVIYSNYGFIVDNVVTAELNGSTGYEYEN